MPLPWALRGLREGVVTSRWPRRRDEYFDWFPATVEVDQTPATIGKRRELAHQNTLDQLCPTGAICATEDGDLSLDRGSCVLCGRCVDAVPEVFSWARGAGISSLTRSQLVVGDVGEDDGTDLASIRSELAHRVRRLRRSIHIRHVDAGSDGSDEWEAQALLNPVYDIHRLGIFFTASPRHADILLVTGIGTSGMTAPLHRTREAMPEPVVVIATGTDAVSGGLLGHGYSDGPGIGGLIDVDIWVPGAPASPFTLMHALLLAVDRLPHHRPPPAPRLGVLPQQNPRELDNTSIADQAAEYGGA